jgi:hypothetical protein
MEDKTGKCTNIDLSEIERTVDVSELMKTYDVLGQVTTGVPGHVAKVLARAVQVGSRNIRLRSTSVPVELLMNRYDDLNSES